MKKIPSLFMREDAASGKQSLVVPVVTPGCEWALTKDGPGNAMASWSATVKWDGTAVLVKDGVLYARFDAKHGKPPPKDGIPCQEPDPVTGHWPHWVPATRPEDRWIREAMTGRVCVDGSVMQDHEPLAPGTYEAVGPKIQGNPHGLPAHALVKHGNSGWFDSDFKALTFEGIREHLAAREIEGLVWHHRDGRMCKIKRKDFDLPWPVPMTARVALL